MNLQGGILVLTSLRGADGQVYAVAQGPVVTGGFAAGRGAYETVNHPTVGRSPNGATVERPRLGRSQDLLCRLQLQQADFTTLPRIVAAINRKFGGRGARRKSGIGRRVADSRRTRLPHD